MRFYGSVGFYEGTVETKPGVFQPKLIEKAYTGNVSWNNRHFQPTENQNEDLRLNNQITILADFYSQKNFASIRYVVWNGVKWRVTNVEVKYPSLTLTIGGVYNGTGAKETSPS